MYYFGKLHIVRMLDLEKNKKNLKILIHKLKSLN